MSFNVNSPLLFVLVGIVVIVVMAQSVFFLMKALKRAGEIGISKEQVRKTIRMSAIFTIAPAVAIVISVIALSKDLGIPLPWLRLSVIGSMSYETIAASNAESAMGLVFGQVASLNATQYVTIVLVMTLSILTGIWLVPLIGKKLQDGVISMENRDAKWGELFQNSLFIGMISAFLGYVFSDVLSITHGSMVGLIPPCVMIVSALVMVLCGLGLKKLGWAWLNDYALPLSLVIGMAAAIPITAWLS